jgi:hypothetical protein
MFIIELELIMSKYKINVRTLKGDLLTYHISEYKIENGLLIFTDEKTGKVKRYPINNTEIEEVDK